MEEKEPKEKEKAIDISLSEHEVKALIARTGGLWPPIEVEASDNYYKKIGDDATNHCNCDK